MHDRIHRIERICIRSMKAAKAGKWGLDEKVYKSEIQRIERQLGVKVELKKEKITSGLNDVRISWDDAFRYKHLTLPQSAYISLWYDEEPPTDSYAEKLSLQTWRAIAIAENCNTDVAN